MGLNTVELIYKIEKQFNIRIPNNEASKIFLVQDIYNIVERHLLNDNRVYDNFENIIYEIIADHAGVDLNEVQPHKSIISDLGMD